MLTRGIFLPVCTTGQKVKVLDEGFVSKNSADVITFESTFVKAFLGKDTPIGYKYNSLVFGTCDSRLINIFAKQLTLRNAVIESKTAGVVERPEKKAHFEVLRERFRAYFDKNHSVSTSGILRGIVLGDKTGIGKDLRELMVRTGTIHIMVASGFNVILVAGIVLLLFKPLVGKYNAYVLSLIVLLGYVFLTDFEAPILRAYLMYLMVVSGKFLGRGTQASRSLYFAVLILIFIDPWIVWDVGFQLSVAATYGLVALQPLFDRWMRLYLSVRLLWLSKTELSTTLAAFLITTPIIFWHFGRVSIMSILANMLIGPLVPILTTLGFLELGMNILKVPWEGMVPVSTEILAEIILRILYMFQ